MTDGSAHREHKAAMRVHARAARQAIPAEERVPLSRAACERLLSLPRIASASTVLAYAASSEEIDPLPAVESLRLSGCLIVYPRVTGPGALTLHLIESEAALENGAYGLREPGAGAPSVKTDDIDLVIVPGVAFDASGHRLGYGAGFYDRLLARMPHAYSVGLAYDGQIVPALPAEEHDRRLDVIVTPTTLHQSLTGR